MLKIKNPDMIFPGQVFDLPVLREKINSIIGLSDHSLGDNGAMLAVACGAKVIEKHIIQLK